MKRTPYKKALKEADDWCSKYVRLRDKLVNNGMCLICNIRPIECDYHIFPRQHLAVRHNKSNNVGACRGCNFNEFIDRRTENKERLKARYIEMLGIDLYTELEAKHREKVKLSAEELLDIAQQFRNMYNDLKGI
jgi:hypothetical protein